jgi:uncharacterized radical SAM protein YgiQ
MKTLTDEKLTIVGAAGMIGSNMAQTAIMMGLTSNICLYDPYAPGLEGVAEELFHCGFEGVNITFTSDIKKALTGAKYIVNSGGAARKAGMTREDLLKGNAAIAEEFGKNVKAYCPDVKHIVVIFNPADITGLITLLYSGLKPSQVTTLAALDSTRLRSELAKHFGVSMDVVENCRTYGGHGEQMAVYASTAKVNGKPLAGMIGTDALTKEQWAEIQTKVTKGGANIIALRGRSSFQSPSYVSIEMIAAAMGGIEASLRRVTHYDYWQDKLLPGILKDSPADLLIYGMGELPLKELVCRLQAGIPFHEIKDIRQTAYLADTVEPLPEDINLFSHEECLHDKLKQAKNFKHIEEESNKQQASRILQKVGKQTIVVNPPFPPMTEEEIDASFDLPYTRLPHPKYKGKTIPAFEMIKFSVNIHRGCFGGCAFCTISAHQGKFIASRSKESILKEVKEITQMPDFKGYLSDLGGPSANMYRMKGKNPDICAQCKKPSCISPVICKNLNADHTPLLDIYKEVDNIPEIKRSFVGSGIRYDLLLHRYTDDNLNKAAHTYMEELIARHVSGRLKVAPEHTEDNVLKMMRKPSFELFGQFKKIFDRVNKQHGLNQQLIPYFISSHPGCTETDMANLAIQTKKLHFQLEQVQDFTPTPMTLATEMYYTGYHPYTLEKVYTARTKEQKLAQRQFFFWYKPEFRRQITQALQRIGKKDLIGKLFGR